MVRATNSMNIIDAYLYSKNNSLQREDANFVIEKHLLHMNWRLADNIMDVGTGEGTILKNIILPKLPKNFKKLVGIDISDKMLQIARETVRDHRIEFRLLDVATPNIPLELCGNFDHIFSFHCLNWVLEKRQAFQNLFDVLRPGGDMLLTIVQDHPIFEIHKTMPHVYKKWAHFKKGIEKNISAYIHSTDATGEIKGYLQEAGFINSKCDLINRVGVHENMEELWNWTMGVNPFIKHVFPEDFNEYKQDYLNLARKIIQLKNYYKNGKIYLPYKILIIFASKPAQLIQN